VTAGERGPRVLHHARHRDVGSSHYKYVARPTKFGNPFNIGEDGTREEVIAKYREWLLAQTELVAAAKAELRGCDLGCWCAPEPCHADVLLEIANGDEDGDKR
jgi:hypothetical protein